MRVIILTILLLGIFTHAIEQSQHASFNLDAETKKVQLSDQVFNLPGLNGPLNVNQYAGYLNVDQQHDRNIFYWFFESQSNPADDPVLLWLQGGPGCSGLTGLFTENGPFIAGPDPEKLLMNDFSWNKIANVIYIEAPAGVGFSYSKNTSDYTTNDKQTADDNWKAMVAFFNKFPQFRKNQFFITGESYGGHYLPDLAALIQQRNKAGDFNINLQGFFLGNPLMDLTSNQRQGQWPTWYSHAVISKTTYDNLMKFCTDINNPTSECNKWQNQANKELQGIDPYDLYVDVCTSGSMIKKRMLEFMHSGSARELSLAPPSTVPYQPCIDTYVNQYLNRNDVQQAIHANTDLPYQWGECSNIINYSQKDVERSMLPYYQEFLKEKDLKIQIYYGDLDSVCPYLSSVYWTEGLNRTIIEPWTPYMVDGQVGGYTVKYDGISLATVRRAGHMVPEFAPATALVALKNFLYQN